jgi:hypothetical protein
MRVRSVLRALGLVEQADVAVGELSGGQRRRLTIGLALLSLPSVLLLDEPTSGLAAPQAHAVVERLRDLASRWGTAVATTIHAPAGATFELFSHVLLLRRGGRVAYHAAVDAAPRFFGLEAPIAAGENPADVLIEAIVNAPDDDAAAGAAGATTDKPRAAGALPLWPPTRSAAGGPSGGSAHPPILVGARPAGAGGAPGARALPRAAETTPSDALLVAARIASQRAFAPPTASAVVGAVVRRKWTLLHRNKKLLRVMGVQNTLCALFLASVYWGQHSVHAHGELLYFGTQYFCFSTIRGVSFLFDVRRVFAREVADAGVPYVVGTWASNIFGELHFLGALTLIYCAVLWLTTGLGSYVDTPFLQPDKFAYFYLAIFLTCLCASFTVQLCAAFVASEQQTVPLFITVSLFIAFFSGFPILLSQLHPWWRWAADASFFRWTIQGLFKNQFDIFDEYEGHPILEMYSFEGVDKWACHHLVMVITAAIAGAQLLLLVARRKSIR